MIQGFIGSAAMKAAPDLEVFTHVADRAASPEQSATVKKTTLRVRIDYPPATTPCPRG